MALTGPKIKPIDDLIDHLKGTNPYGRTETLKLWEALKRLSDGIFKARAITTKQIALKSITSAELGAEIAAELTGKATVWNTDIVFSATDADTVAWTAGTIKFPDASASMIAGNTGNMTGLTYIYYHPSVSNTALQVTTTFSDVVGNDRILLCVANKTTDATQLAFFIPAVGVFGINETVIGPNSISTGKIQALSITTGLLAANSVTAAKISVAQLDAISANCGTLTSGTITAGVAVLSSIAANQITTGTIAASVSITLTRSDTVPSKFIWDSTGTMYADVSNSVIYLEPLTNGTNFLYLGADSHPKGWQGIRLYTSETTRSNIRLKSYNSTSNTNTQIFIDSNSAGSVIDLIVDDITTLEITSVDIVPGTTATFNIGNSTLKWKNATFSGTITAGNFSGTYLTAISANQVIYSNGSQLTSSSSLYWDGTNLGVGGTGSIKLHVLSTSTESARFQTTQTSMQLHLYPNGTDHGYIYATNNSSIGLAYTRSGANEAIDISSGVVAALVAGSTVFKVDGTESTTNTAAYIYFNGSLRQAKIDASDLGSGVKNYVYLA